jgi:hypothetical protein
MVLLRHLTKTLLVPSRSGPMVVLPLFHAVVAVTHPASSYPFVVGDMPSLFQQGVAGNPCP